MTWKVGTPVHLPDGEYRASELVNLGYVANVIEDPSERTETLKTAWGLAERVMVVAARDRVPGW